MTNGDEALFIGLTIPLDGGLEEFYVLLLASCC